MSFADLHCHTTYSDGVLTVEELLVQAKEAGLSALSITDHDTVAAYATALPIAKKMGILLGNGIEFSCEFEKTNVHVLGYDFRLDHPAIIQLCSKHKERRHARNRAILEKLAQYKMAIAPWELDEFEEKTERSIGRPHIAWLMVRHGYVENAQAAFDLYIGDGKKAYVRGSFFSVDETIEVIHQAEGKAFLAHPHFLNRSLVRKLVEKPFDGLEEKCARPMPEEEKFLKKIAVDKGLLLSAGSDFHGFNRPFAKLGASTVDREKFFQIFNRHLSR